MQQHLTAAGGVAGGTLGIISITAGANATRVGKYADVGTSDVRMLLTNTKLVLVVQDF